MENLLQNNWPVFNYEEFKSTGYLLHRIVQILGKIKLKTPFEPHWANVALSLTSRGFTTGLIPYRNYFFSIDLDLINHQIIIHTSLGETTRFSLDFHTVAQFTKAFFSYMQKLNINLDINLMPQEISNPIAFDLDTTECFYNKKLATTWWRILLTSYRIMSIHHACFNGETPPIGLMWGTFDLRDARYNGKHVKTKGINSGYIRRNAMDEEQVEIGFWPGNEAYPRPAYFSFTYPQPPKIENSIIQPKAAYWNSTLMEFVLDYAELQQSQHPEQDLLDFFESTYATGARLAGWNPKLITSGKPD